MKTKKSVILEAINMLGNIENHKKFRITLTTKDGKKNTTTFSIGSSYKKSVKERLMHECRCMTLNRQKYIEGSKDDRFDHDLSLKNIESISIKALD